MEFLLDRLGLGMPTPRLFGERVQLRPGHVRDWRAWASLRSESRDFLTPWEPTWPVDALSRHAFRRRLRRLSSEARLDWGHSFLVFRRADQALLGGLTLSGLRRGVAQSCSVGYWIGQPYARQGYMREALKLTLQYVFEDLRLHRVEAACLPENVPSRRLLLGVGFSEEGLARQYLRINGEWCDHVLFGLVASAWAARQNQGAIVGERQPG